MEYTNQLGAIITGPNIKPHFPPLAMTLKNNLLLLWWQVRISIFFVNVKIAFVSVNMAFTHDGHKDRDVWIDILDYLLHFILLHRSYMSIRPNHVRRYILNKRSSWEKEASPVLKNEERSAIEPRCNIWQIRNTVISHLSPQRVWMKNSSPWNCQEIAQDDAHNNSWQF